MKYAFLFLLIFPFAGCAGIFPTEETAWEYVQDRKLDEVRIGSVDYIRVRGFLMSSGNAVKRSKIEPVSDAEIWVHVTEGLVSGDSGNFDLLVPITDKTKAIYFGRGKTVIWSRR